jgi:titin
VNGSELTLAWRNTFEGGAPAALLLDVSGALTASLPLPLGDVFSFTGVSGGTYTLRLRATNAAGASTASNPVTLTFPGACSGVPAVPANFLATKTGNRITVVWDSPANGPAPTGFALTVGGSFDGDIATTLRSLSGEVGPGTYSLHVRATNPCGAGPATAPQVITIPE